jgi:hypothetical protein
MLVSTMDFSTVEWRKSSYSSDGTNGNCVEVAFVGAAVGVRDSKKPAGGALVLGTATWAAFTEAVRR